MQRQPVTRAETEPGRYGVRTALTGAALCLGAAVTGATVATFVVPTHTHIGGAEAALKLRFGSHSDANTGSNALLGLKFPVHYGPVSLHATIDNFGFGLTPGLNPDIKNEYGQLFSDSRQDAANVSMAIAHQAETGALIGVGLLAALAGSEVGWRTLRRQRNPRLAAVYESLVVKEHVKRRRQLIGAGLGVAALVSSGIQYTNNSAPLRANALFDGTALHGAELDGLLAPAISSLVPFIATRIKSTDEYYARDEQQLVTSFKEQIGTLPADPDTFNIMTISDRHCNTGMNRVIKRLAKLYHAVLILDAGDNAFSGSFSFESACVTSLMDSLKHVAPVVTALGNHDSGLTEAAAVKSKMIVLLNNKPITLTVAGINLRLIGAADPRTSRYGEGIRPASIQSQNEALLQVGASIADQTCREKFMGTPVDIVLAHSLLMVQTALNADCGPSLGVAGHTHQKVGPLVETGLASGISPVLLTEGSTGGAGLNEGGGLTIAGPLLAPATATIITIDKKTKRPVGSYDIVNFPDGSFRLSRYVSLLPNVAAANHNNRLHHNATANHSVAVVQHG